MQQEHRPVLHSPVWTFVPYPPEPGWWVMTGFDILDIWSCALAWVQLLETPKSETRWSWSALITAKPSITHTPSVTFTHEVRRGADANVHTHACKRWNVDYENVLTQNELLLHIIVYKKLLTCLNRTQPTEKAQNNWLSTKQQQQQHLLLLSRKTMKFNLKLLNVKSSTLELELQTMSNRNEQEWAWLIYFV